MLEKIKTIWKDPVGSKIISAIILGLSALIYNYIISVNTSTTFKSNISDFLNHKISLWLYILFTIIILIVYPIIITLIKNYKTVSFKYDEGTLNLDKALFVKIKNELLPISSINWLKNNNFGGISFNDKHLEPFENFELENENPEFDFFNPELNNLLNDLSESIKEFNSFLLPNVFTESIDRITVPPEWRYEQPERYDNAVIGIHKRARDVNEKYENLLKTCRKVLKVQ